MVESVAKLILEGDITEKLKWVWASSQRAIWEFLTDQIQSFVEELTLQLRQK